MMRSSEESDSETENNSGALHLEFSHLQLYDAATGVTPNLPNTSGLSKGLDAPADYAVSSDSAPNCKEERGNLTTHDFFKHVKTNVQLREMKTRSCSSSFRSFEGIRAEGVDSYVDKAASSSAPASPGHTGGKKDFELLGLSQKKSFHSDFNVQGATSNAENPYVPCRCVIFVSDRRIKNKSGRYPNLDTSIMKTRSFSSIFNSFEGIEAEGIESYVNKATSSSASDPEERKTNSELLQMPRRKPFHLDSNIQAASSSGKNPYGPVKCAILMSGGRLKNRPRRYLNSSWNPFPSRRVKKPCFQNKITGRTNRIHKAFLSLGDCCEFAFLETKEMRRQKRKVQFQMVKAMWKKVSRISDCYHSDINGLFVDETPESSEEISAETRKSEDDPANVGMGEPSSSTVISAPETLNKQIETITRNVKNIRLSGEILKSRRDAKQSRSTTVCQNDSQPTTQRISSRRETISQKKKTKCGECLLRRMLRQRNSRKCTSASGTAGKRKTHIHF